MSTEFTPITIKGIVDSEIGSPRNDGTPDSSLYTVPLKLSALAPSEWAAIFVEAFDHPSESTKGHRRGIASVHGNRIILNGTTVDEIRKIHRKTWRMHLPLRMASISRY